MCHFGNYFWLKLLEYTNATPWLIQDIKACEKLWPNYSQIRQIYYVTGRVQPSVERGLHAIEFLTTDHMGQI
jgi:hypothetical protein